MTGWGDIERLGDEELVDQLIGTSLPERSERRGVLFEVLRERCKDIPVRAFRQAGGDRAIEDDFLAWFWTFERLDASLAAHRRTQPRAPLGSYLFVKSKWLVLDFFRSHKQQPKVRPLVIDVPARAGDEVHDDQQEARLASLRDCVERLAPTNRVPFKLVHVAAVELTEEDLAILEKKSGRPRAALETTLAALRRAGRPLTLAEVGDLMSMKLHTVGTYVARAQHAIRECVRRKAEREGVR